MVKRLVAGAVLLILFGLVVYTITSEKEQTGPEEYNVSGKTGQEGTAMVPPNSSEGLEPGDRAPDFELETLAGETVKLSDLKGKKIFLNFWATWCPPCKEEMPEMQKFQEEFGDEVVILAVNVTGSETSVKKVKKYIEEKGYSFTVALDKEDEVTDQYHAFTIPTTYFIGTDGTIQQKRKVGPMTYDFMVEMKEKLK
ncbi:peroxiredoxin family protein [Thalassobacillus pellis]|uniref:peroxiredoxin family protein n=1 Tax=Thalassobacillus pellis TaxID=748008 RepID=UPI001960B83B|nr:TlpA disulfide reductase family protein [Thalassobacillus pellis]MBM7552627.1 peroxiredoxin [Thalassobacillus pellis]